MNKKTKKPNKEKINYVEGDTYMNLDVCFRPNSLRILNEIINTNTLAGSIFLFFAEYMSIENEVACSYNFLTEIFSTNVKTISNAIEFLVSENLIKKEKSGDMIIYRLSEELVYKHE